MDFQMEYPPCIASGMKAEPNSWSILLCKASLAEVEPPSDWDYCQIIAELLGRIERLEAEVRSLKMPVYAPPRPSLYDASAHLRPKP